MSRNQPLKRSNAGKSARRWADGRKLAECVMPTLPGVSYCAVLWTCWFHAELTEDDQKTVFDLTKGQIAKECCLSEKHVQRLLRDLERAGVIRTRKDGCNSGGRSLGSERLITYKPYREKSENGCADAPVLDEKRGAPECSKGSA